jgi:hypothetical protein
MKWGIYWIRLVPDTVQCRALESAVMKHTCQRFSRTSEKIKSCSVVSLFITVLCFCSGLDHTLTCVCVCVFLFCLLKLISCIKNSNFCADIFICELIYPTKYFYFLLRNVGFYFSSEDGGTPNSNSDFRSILHTSSSQQFVPFPFCITCSISRRDWIDGSPPCILSPRQRDSFLK